MVAAERDDRVSDPMIYDAMLELATRISGECVARARDADGEDEVARWRAEGIRVREQVRAVDPDSRSAIEAKRAELRELWASLAETVAAPAA